MKEKKMELIQNEEELIEALKEKKVVVAITKKNYDLVKPFLVEKPKFIKVGGDGGYGKANATKLVKVIAETFKIEEAIYQMSIIYKLMGDVSIRILTENGEEIKKELPFGDLEISIKMAIMTAKCVSGPEEGSKTIQVITRRGEKVYVTQEDDDED